ncbi:oligosaccharide flippase family protein [Acinetobacter baumannii]|nr:oligosaccharide flippase family protein [Acinetobacter baumannii]
MDRAKEISLIKSNFLSFGILKIFDYVFPLLILPLLVRALDVTEYGYYVIAGATVIFARLIVAFGFELTATKELALINNDIENISKIFLSITSIKIFFFILLGLILGLVYLIMRPSMVGDYWWLFLILFFTLLGDEVLYSSWFYIGMQKAKILSFFKISQRFLLLIGVFFLSKFDNVLFNIVCLELFLALSFGVISIIYLIKFFKIKKTVITLNECMLNIKRGYYVFLSNFSVYMYSSINTLIIGGTLGPKSAGSYAICERIYMAVRAAFEPFTQAVYPYLNRLYVNNKIDYLKFSKKILIIYFFLLLIISIILYFIKGLIIFYIMGRKSIEIENILFFFILALPLALGGMLSKYLIISEKSNLLFRVTFISMLVNLAIIFPLVNLIRLEGAVIAFIIVQLVQLLIQFYYYRQGFKR